MTSAETCVVAWTAELESNSISSSRSAKVEAVPAGGTTDFWRVRRSRAASAEPEMVVVVLY